MSDASPTFMGCAACIGVQDANEKAQALNAKDILLSVPSMHCAACMSKIEAALEANSAILNARANLSLKRVTISAKSGEASDFIRTLQDLGYDAFELDQSMVTRSEDETARRYLLRLGIAGFAMMNVMLLSVSVWSGANASTRDLLHWVSAMIAIPAVIYAAQPFFRNAWSALKNRSLNMDVPISLAVILALTMSVYDTSQSGQHAYFDAALSLTFFLLIGRYLDYRTRSMARSAAQELAALESKKTLRIEAFGDAMVEVSELKVGDVIRVLPGARIPVDGVILSGESEVDTSFITGESLPRYFGVGSELRAGLLNITGMMTMRVDKIGSDTSLQQIAELVAIAENGRNLYTSLADRAARIYAPLVHLLAIAAFITWMILGSGWHFAMSVAIAVLVITCPCALGLAVPAVNTAASGRLFRKSVLLKSETAMERLAEIDAVVFDKTGTLTQGAPEIIDIQGGNLEIALGLARHSAHPLSRAIASALEAQNVTALPIEDVTETPGQGLRGLYKGEKVSLGRPTDAQSNRAEMMSELRVGNECTRFLFQDKMRQGVARSVENFQKAGIETWLLSGDHQNAVNQFAKRIGITNLQSEMTPQDKARFIAALKSEGRKVLMIGDGLNDTAALVEAHISIAPGDAIDITRSASDILILNSDFSVVFEAFQIAKVAKHRMIENFSLAAIYNLIAVPIALLGFATPLLAALAMSASSIMVVLNANRIRWMK